MKFVWSIIVCIILTTAFPPLSAVTEESSHLNVEEQEVFDNYWSKFGSGSEVFRWVYQANPDAKETIEAAFKAHLLEDFSTGSKPAPEKFQAFIRELMILGARMRAKYLPLAGDAEIIDFVHKELALSLAVIKSRGIDCGSSMNIDEIYTWIPSLIKNGVEASVSQARKARGVALVRAFKSAKANEMNPPSILSMKEFNRLSSKWDKELDDSKEKNELCQSARVIKVYLEQVPKKQLGPLLRRGYK